MHYIIPLYAIFFFTSLLMPIAIKSAACIGIMDCPDSRKVHKIPIPRTGGIVIAFSVLTLYLCVTDVSYFSIAYLCGGGIIFFSGIVDDCRSLDYKWKFLLQGLSALFFILISGNSIDFIGAAIPGLSSYTQILRIPLTILFIVATINIINLSDGLDALAAGLSIIVLICISFLAYSSSNFPVVYLSIITIGAVLGFLRFNVFPASVFMGDTGSQFIGYTIGVSLISITQSGSIYSPLISLFVLGMPIIDTFYVVYFRLSNGQHPFLPDKNHIHHKLLTLGFSQDKSVAIIYAMHFFLIIFGWYMRLSSYYLLLIVYIFLFLVFFSILKFGFTNDTVRKIFFSRINNRVKKVKKSNYFFSRLFFSKIVWNLFFICLGCYYAAAPLLSEKINYNTLILFLSLFVAFFSLYFFKLIVNPVWVKLFFYLITLFVVIYFPSTLLFHFKENIYHVYVHDIFFICLTMLYFLCVIFSPEKAPINSIDYIFIIFIIFIFFIPDSISFTLKFKSIISKIILLGFFINLVFSRIDRNKKFIFSIFIYLFIAVFIKIAITTISI